MAKEVKEVVENATARVRRSVEEVRAILESRGADMLTATILNARITTIQITDENGEVREENRFVLNLDKTIKASWGQDDNREIGDGNTIMVSPISMYAVIGHDSLFSRFLTTWHNKPSLLCAHLSDCQITLAQEEVKAGEVYTNPFSDKTSEIKNDTVINTVLDIAAKGLSKKHMEEQLMGTDLF